MSVEVKNYRANFNWTKQELLTLASHESLYSTRTIENSDVLSFTEDERLFFDDNIKEVILSLTSLFWRTMDDLDTIIDSSDKIGFSMSLRNSYASASLDIIDENATKYIAYSMLQKWYSINNIVQLSQLYTTKAAGCVAFIQNAMFRFNRPNTGVAFEIVKL